MVSRSRLTRWGVAPVLVLLSAVFFGGCDPKTPSILDPKGPVALAESNLFWIIFGIATFIFVVVAGWLLFSIIKYRERPGMPDPRQTHGNTKIEIAWTIAPSIVLFVVLIFTISSMFQLAEPASANTLKVRAVGHQWWWEFQYEGTAPAVVTGDELHIPVGTVVHVDLSSNNVIHSFWVPSLTGKTDVIPGHDNFLWLKADKPGSFRGECAEYCGTQHANMNFVVIADPPDVFASWLNAQQAAAMAPTTPQQQSGFALLKTAGCVGCHAISGVNTDAQGRGPTIGPNLTHFGSRTLIAGGVLSNTSDNLATWLSDPQNVKPGNDMIIRKLSPSEISDLVAYLESLK